YIPLGHAFSQNLDRDLVLAALRPILEDAAYPKALQNAKFDRLVLQFQGICLRGVVFDTMLASYVLNPESSHNLTELSRRYLGITAQSYASLVPKGQTIADLPIPTVAAYCGLDVYTTFHLVEKLRAELAQAPALQDLLLKIEQPLEPVLAAMETYGIRIDQAYLQTFSTQLEHDLQRLESQAYTLAGETFNLGSPKQLSDILFQKLGLDAKKSRKTKLGFSTDAATLEKLQGDHPLVDVLLEYRTLAKLKSTYVDALPALVRDDTHRVHTDFNQAVTATGRLSSSNPNLQNIPIRTAFSRQIRAAFIPEPGWTLISADYSQIELRILAHLSGEPRLVEAYRGNQDVHTLTAQLLLEKETVSSEERRLGKIINFGVIYGMGAQRFSREAGVRLSDAKVFIERFYERYPAVFAYLQRMECQAIAQGYVETILGRRRYFAFDSSSLKQLRHKPLEEVAALDLGKLKMTAYERGLLRAAANAPIQGSSADLVKIAMVRLHEAIAPYQAHLLLQVHDELILEAHPSDLEAVTLAIQEAMQNALTLSVPLVAEVHTGPNWMAAK
ncbi:MAG TPA: DNA polymerase I, partial [Stenomitos sp.]